MGIERIGNLGYAAFAPEATPGAPATPTHFTLLMDESLSTDPNLQTQEPAFGSKSEVFAVLPGLRDHKGDITIVAEPNTLTHLLNIFLTAGAQSGSGPYTQQFDHSGNSKTGTLDISTGNVVKRFGGVVASKLVPVWNKNELHIKASLSALKSFQGNLITSVSGSGPYTVNLDALYDTQPAGLLVAGDLIRFYNPTDGSTVDAVVATVDTNKQYITTTTNVSTFGSGTCVMYLRPQTVALNTLQTFLWSNTQFCFGATASAALAASQTRVEQGSNWELNHNLNDDNGESRSGSADPASLIRTTVNGATNIKRFFDTPEDLIAMQQQSKSALAIHHYAGAPVAGAFPYDFCIVYHHLKTNDPMPNIQPKKVNYGSIKYLPQHDQTDGVMFHVFTKSTVSSLAT
jgi:hypothetical protein